MEIDELIKSLLETHNLVQQIESNQELILSEFATLKKELREFHNHRFLDQWIRIDEVASHLGISKRRLYQEIRDGNLTASRFSKKVVLIDQKALKQLMEKYQIKQLDNLT